MGRSGSKRLSRKGSLKWGGTWSGRGDEGITVDLGGGVTNSLHSGASEMEMYVDSSMRMEVGEELSAMSEGSGWLLGIMIPSFYPGGGGTCDIPGSNGGQIRFDGAPRNCQRWDTLSTSQGIGVRDFSLNGDD